MTKTPTPLLPAEFEKLTPGEKLQYLSRLQKALAEATPDAPIVDAPLPDRTKDEAPKKKDEGSHQK